MGDETDALKEDFEPSENLAALFAEGQFFQSVLGVLWDLFNLDFFGGGELEKREGVTVFTSVSPCRVEHLGEVNGERNARVSLSENALRECSSSQQL